MPCNTVFNYALFINSPVHHAYSNTFQVQQVYGNGREMDAKGDVKPENLPPTDSTAINHILRVHQQTITWETLAATTANPLHWD